MFKKYFDAWKRFRDGLESKPDGALSLEMHRAARDLSQRPEMESFAGLIQRVEEGKIWPDLQPEQRAAMLKFLCNSNVMMNLEHEAEVNGHRPPELEEALKRIEGQDVVDRRALLPSNSNARQSCGVSPAR